MKDLELEVPCHFSECAVEAAINIIQIKRALNTSTSNFSAIPSFKLRVSVFDIKLAVKMLVNINIIDYIAEFTVTPTLRSGEWVLTDYAEEYRIHSEA